MAHYPTMLRGLEKVALRRRGFHDYPLYREPIIATSSRRNDDNYCLWFLAIARISSQTKCAPSLVDVALFFASFFITLYDLSHFSNLFVIPLTARIPYTRIHAIFNSECLLQ